MCFFFFFNHPAPTAIYTLSLHDALPICPVERGHVKSIVVREPVKLLARFIQQQAIFSRRSTGQLRHLRDRKSTRLNSSHVEISYAVFCLKKKKKTNSCSISTRTTTRLRS